MVISDIHGCYQELNALLQKVNYNPPADQLVLIGDYVDRGPDSREVVQQVLKLHQEWGVVVLKGNHDKMACDALMNEDDKLDTHWLTNGGYSTLMSYCGEDSEFCKPDAGWQEYMKLKEFIRREYREHLDFLSSLPLYYETGSHLYVHAGIDPALEDWRSQRPYDFIWIRKPFYSHPVTSTDKTVVFGHTPAVELHNSPEIWFSPHGDKIGIDGACAYGEQLNCLEISAEGRYRTHYVRPGEMEGR